MSRDREGDKSVVGRLAELGASAPVRIFYMDGGLGIGAVLEGLLRERGYGVRVYGSRHGLYKDLAGQGCDLLMIGSGDDERGALDLVRETKRVYPSLPVLLLVRESDLYLVIEAMRAGVFDVIKQPFERKVLLTAILSALGRRRGHGGSRNEKPLTDREEQVLQLIGDGKCNRDIAELLRISVRTVEFHRSRIMRKLGVEHFAGLIKQAIWLGLTSLERPMVARGELEVESGQYSQMQ